MKNQIQYFSVILVTIFSFEYRQIYGQNPPEFYGATNGGEFDMGVIFRTDGDGNNYQVIYDFPASNLGRNPTIKLCEANNGKLYGMTSEGGIDDGGVLFEWDPVTNVYTEKFIFDGLHSGKNPIGYLVLANNGKLYGITSEGGENDCGILYEWDPVDDIFTNKMNFSRGDSGGYPQSSLVLTDNGKLYGMTYTGGAYDFGVIFEWDPDNNFYTKKFDFNDQTGAPCGTSLIQAKNGNLYGMTTFFGACLFEWNPYTGCFVKRIEFNEEAGRPCGRGYLVEAINGKFYALSTGGGSYNKGVLFEWDPDSNIYRIKVNFNGIEMGESPYGSLLQANNGKLYGSTSFGGLNNEGVFFEYDPRTNLFIKRFDFSEFESGKGSVTLIQTSNGKIYGTTWTGGANQMGTIFEWDPTTNAYTKKFDFNLGEEGRSPIGELVKADDETLIGLTCNGGKYGRGTLFEFNITDHNCTKVFDFNGMEKGSEPHSILVKALNGKFYGTTCLGGINNEGVLYEWDHLTHCLTKKLDFNEIQYGKYPGSSMMLADNGKLYGVCSMGGIDNSGVLYEFNPVNGVFIKKHDFNGSDNGRFPSGPLVQGDNGKLYGMTLNGGANDEGILYEFDLISNSFSKIHDFTRAINGAHPSSLLVKAEDGRLFGMTMCGGLFDHGVIFEFDPLVNSITKKFDCHDSVNGSEPCGSLIQASNGKLYGMTSKGGSFDKGVLYEWDPLTNIINNKFEFNGSEGRNPAGRLLEVNYKSSKTVNSQSINYSADYSKPAIYFDASVKDSLMNSMNDAVIIYPNPNQGSFSIDLRKKYSHVLVTVVTPDGRLIQTGEFKDIKDLNMKIDVQPGIYIITLITDEKKTAYRIINK